MNYTAYEIAALDDDTRALELGRKWFAGKGFDDETLISEVRNEIEGELGFNAIAAVSWQDEQNWPAGV